MILDYENGITGGIARAICHYAEAKNIYMFTSDESKERSYDLYLAFNNQYGWALSEPISCAVFEYWKYLIFYNELYQKL